MPETADNISVELCTIEGGDHDYRPKTYTSWNRPHTSLVCVWCDVVACGNVGKPDPCIEPYHHHVPHRTAAGVRWPIGGNRG